MIGGAGLGTRYRLGAVCINAVPATLTSQALIICNAQPAIVACKNEARARPPTNEPASLY